MITRRLAVLSFAAIQSSVITLTNLLFDLASSPLLATYCTTLDMEVKSELANEHGIWSKKALARMRCIDSTIRESMRLGGFITRGICKLVMRPGGITLPNGVHIPQGVKVGVSQYSIHHDEDVYQNALAFDAFRFSRSENEENSDKRPAIVRTSPTFMAFSHGPHAWYVSSPHFSVRYYPAIFTVLRTNS